MKYKRFICLVLCFTLIFQMFFYKYHELKAEASDFVMPSDTYMKAVIATALVSGGLMFRSEQSLNDTVEKVKLKIIEGGLNSTLPPWGPRPPRSWQDVLTSLGSVYLVYDFVTGGYKQVVDLGNDFFQWIKNLIDENFNEGENSLVDENSLNYSIGDYFLNVKLLPIVDGKFAYLSYTNGYNSGELNFLNFGGSGSVTSVVLKYIYLDHTSGSTIYFGVNFDFYVDGSFNRNMNSSSLFSLSYPEIINNPELLSDEEEEDKVTGVPGKVDNPNRDWNNETAGNKSIAFDVALGPDGLPLLDPAGRPIPALPPDFMVNVNPDSIPQQDVTGLPYTPPEGGEVTDPVSPPYPDDLPQVDIDTPNKRSLLMKKFPFCLPYDLKNVFRLLQASAEAPKFEMDFMSDSGLNRKLGVTGSTKIVLDMNEFPLVGQLSRFFSLIGACLGLILTSRKIMNS